MAVPPRGGSPVVLAVASEDVGIPRLRPRGPLDLVSMRPLGLAGLAEGSAVASEVEEVAFVVGIAVIAPVVPEEALAIKVHAMGLAGRRPTLPLALAAGVEDLEDPKEVEADSTEVSPAATGSLFGPATAMRTVIAATTVMGIATGTATACLTAMETETAPVTVTVSATGMAAVTTIPANDTVRMMARTTPAPGDDTRCFVFRMLLSLLFSVSRSWWVSPISRLHYPLSVRVRG